MVAVRYRWGVVALGVVAGKERRWGVVALGVVAGKDRLKLIEHIKTHNTKSRRGNPSNTYTKPPKFSVPSFDGFLSAI